MNGKLLISLLIYTCIFRLYSVNGQGQRQVSALSDICKRFPSLASCKNPDQQAIVTNPPPVTPNSGLATPPNIPSSNDYCTNYKESFVTYCNGRSPDTAIISFCNTYSTKCNAVWSVPTPANVPQQPTPPSVNNSPPPSPFGPNPSQPTDNSVPPFKSQPLNPQPLQPVQPQQPIGQQKGLPSWLLTDKPLAGLGGSPNQLQQFGGPVNGGVGIGNAWQVPFVGASQGLNVVPTQGVMGGKSLNVAGLGFQQTQGVNFGGLPFVSNLNNAWGIAPNALNGMQPVSNNGLFNNGKRRRR